jgi:glycosyltransferase involved in cell wall biosynthesis
MKISVIIPFYNEINLIGRAVSSVYSNFSKNDEFEIIICNDGVINEALIRLNLTNEANQFTTIFKIIR